MTKTTSERSRGRPAKLSREQILSCALKMMQRTPGSKITMTGVAKALNTAPMSLYTHVKHRDDLLDGIAAMVLGQLTLELNPDDPWKKQVRSWLESVHDHLVRYPQIVELLGMSHHIPPAWLQVHVPLMRALQKSGLRGEKLSNTSQWVAAEVIGLLLLGFASGDRKNTPEELEDAIASLEASDRKLITSLMPYFRPEMSLFPFYTDRILDALEVMVEK